MTCRIITNSAQANFFAAYTHKRLVAFVLKDIKRNVNVGFYNPTIEGMIAGMKDIVIIYTSKSGNTKKYVQWLQNELDAEVATAERADYTALSLYKLVIFASPVYNDKIQIMDVVKKNLSAINTMRTMFIVTTWYTTGSAEAAAMLEEQNYPDSFRNRVPMFVLNSGVDKKKLSPLDNLKLVGTQMSIEKREGRTSDEINTLAIIKGYCDETKQENLTEFIKKVKDVLNPSKAVPKPKPKAAEVPAPVQPATRPAPFITPPPRPIIEPIPEIQPMPEPIPESIPEPPVTAPIVSEMTTQPAPRPAPQKKILDISDLKSGLAEFDISYKNTSASEPTPEPAPKPVPEVRTPAPAPIQRSAPQKKILDISDLKSGLAEFDISYKKTPEPEPVPEPAYEPEPTFKPAENHAPQKKILDLSDLSSGLDAFDISKSIKKNEDIQPKPSFDNIPAKPADTTYNSSFSRSAVQPEPQKVQEEKPKKSSFSFDSLTAEFDESLKTKKPSIFSKPEPPDYTEKPAYTEQAPKPKSDIFSKPLAPKPVIQPEPVAYTEQAPKPAVQPEKPAYTEQPAKTEEAPRPQRNTFVRPAPTHNFTDIFDTIEIPEDSLEYMQDLDSPLTTKPKAEQNTAQHVENNFDVNIKSKPGAYDFTQLKADLEAAMATKKEKKFITEPIDSDAFFKKSTKNGEDAPGAMPEIKWK